jgi:hypothetical protein
VHPPRSPKRAVAIVDRKLRDPGVRELVESAYGERGDFTVLDAISKHVEHIKGQPYYVRIKDGPEKDRLVTLRKPGSWPALKAYLDMVLPQPVKKVGAPSRARRGKGRRGAGRPFNAGQTPAPGDH